MSREPHSHFKAQAGLVAGLLLLLLGVAQPGIADAFPLMLQAANSPSIAGGNANQEAVSTLIQPTREFTSDQVLPDSTDHSDQPNHNPPPCGSCCKPAPDRLALAPESVRRLLTAPDYGQASHPIAELDASRINWAWLLASPIPDSPPRTKPNAKFLITARIRI